MSLQSHTISTQISVLTSSTLAPAYQWRDTVTSQSTFTPLAKLVAHILVSYMNNTKISCFPSINTLMEKTSIKSKTTMIKVLKELAAAGYLRIQQRYNQSNIYRLLFPAPVLPILKRVKKQISSAALRLRAWYQKARKSTQTPSTSAGKVGVQNMNPNSQSLIHKKTNQQNTSTSPSSNSTYTPATATYTAKTDTPNRKAFQAWKAKQV